MTGERTEFGVVRTVWGLQSLYCGRDGAKLLRGFMFRGGGGTDFSPAIAEAAKWEPDLPIYLTDLEGEAGEEPTFPVLWAVPEGKAMRPGARLLSWIDETTKAVIPLVKRPSGLPSSPASPESSRPVRPPPPITSRR
jgi:VWA-like domain (DUF2201)